MPTRILQNSFLSGEISPSMLGRTDNSIYSQGAYKLENFAVEVQGSLLSRSGFEWLGEVDSDQNYRLVEFRYASDQTLILLFGDYCMYILTDGEWLYDDDGTLFCLTTPYSAEYIKTLSITQNMDVMTITSRYYAPMYLKRYGVVDWEFEEVTTTAGISPPSTVYASAYYPDDTDDDDKGVITAKYVVTAVDEDGRESVASSIVTCYCNYYLTGGSVTVSWKSVSGAERYRVYRCVCGVYSFLGESTTLSIIDYGDDPDGTYTPPLYEDPFAGETSIRSIEVVSGGSGYVAEPYYEYEYDEDGNVTSETLISQTTLTINDDGDGDGATCYPVIDDGVIVSVLLSTAGSGYEDPYITVNTTYGSGASFTITMNESNTYPQANTQYDQRAVFAGTLAYPTYVWLSNSGYLDLMMYHQPTMSDDRIKIDAVTQDADLIRHAIPLDSLILLTGSGELRVWTQNSDSLTPSSIAVKPQSYRGANDVQPVIIDSFAVYAASRGGHALSVGYDYYIQGYKATDLSIAAPHLFDYYEIVDLAVQKSPMQVIYGVSSAGYMVALTIYNDQNVQAWWKISTDGSFETVACVTEDQYDRVYVVVSREINGETRKYVERLDLLMNDNSEERHNLDCYQTYTTTAEINDTIELTGLDYLEGKSIAVVVRYEQETTDDDGNTTTETVHAEYPIMVDNIEEETTAEDEASAEEIIVEDGVATVTGVGTIPAGAEVTVGLRYTCELITVPLSTQEQSYLQGRVKNTSEVGLRVNFDGDIWANSYPQTSEDELYRVERDSIEYANQGNLSLVYNLSIEGDWDKQGQLWIQHRNTQSLRIQQIVENTSIEDIKS